MLGKWKNTIRSKIGSRKSKRQQDLNGEMQDGDQKKRKYQKIARKEPRIENRSYEMDIGL